MSSSVAIETQVHDSPSSNRGKRGHRGRGGRGGRRGGGADVGVGAGRGVRHRSESQSQSGGPVSTTDEAANAEAMKTVTTIATAATTATTATVTTTETTADADICWICAEPIKYYSLSACNHRTCHVCALRLRALYKKMECTFCKEPQPTVVFTTSPDTDFASYTPDLIPYKDFKLSIFFETEDMMEETLILLRFNCPDSECDYTASGWGDLKLHTRAMHNRVLCDLCIRFKKVFAHEHALYPPNTLPLHLPSIPHRPSKQPTKEPIEGGIHPLCEFCHECFFGDDEMFVHMRERHEECFICRRNEIMHQYFQNYESLEQHFSRAHYACTNSTCQAQKFVVFGSELDLKAHQVEVHGADMTSRDKRDARRIHAEFEFEDSGVGGGAGRRGRRDRGDRARDREREPPPAPGSTQIAQASSVRMGGRRREMFGGHLTEGSQVIQAVPSGRASPVRDDVDPLIAERLAAFTARLQNVAPNPNNAIAAVKAAMRGYRMNEASARDLISTVWNVLDHNLDDTASIINGVVDLLEEEEKKRDLLAAWNGFKIEQRQQFPDLTPTSVGSGYAGIASGRVLNAKHATTSRASQQSSRQLWDRVAQAASASSSSSSTRVVPGAPLPSSSSTQVERFPPLAGPSTNANAPNHPPFRQPQRNTPWVSTSSSNTSYSPAFTPSSVHLPAISPKKAGTGNAQGKKPPLLSASAFPELPTATTTRTKSVVSGNTSLRNILGDAVPATSAWRANEGGQELVAREAAVTGTRAGTGSGIEGSGGGGGKGKKGKGKQKQTLFTLGSFPT